MNCISRFFVSSFGTNTAWYDSHDFDLTDPVTREVVNAIINLENMGGKTSLLSYVFSLFDPHKSRFIQHIQQSNHKMQDYFDQGGELSFILVEWSMPSRRPGAPNIKVILGQAVAVQEGLDREANLQRVFFAFESLAGLAFEDVPAPGLGLTAGIKTFAEFTGWLHQAARRSKGDFFHTRQNNDWVKHLTEVRKIDIELLKMQVKFNSQEGGVDEGFLAFKDEADLVNKLMILTLPSDRVADVRQMVANVADKMKNKPQMDQTLALLNRLSAQMVPFGHASKSYLAMKAEQQGLLSRASGLAFAIETATGEVSKSVDELKLFVESLKDTINANEGMIKSSQAQSLTYKALELSRISERAKSAYEASAADLEHGRKHLRLVHAAIAHKKVLEAQQKLRIEEESLKEEQEGLKPIREKVDEQGALLRAGYDHYLELATTEKDGFVDKRKAAEASTAKAKQEISANGSEQNALTREESDLAAFIKGEAAQQERLRNEGVIDPYDPDAESAITRHEAQVEVLRGNQERLEAEKAQHEAKARGFSEQAKDLGLKAQAAELEEQAVANRLDSAESLKEDLEQSSVLARLQELDLADPDAETLPRLLNDYEQSLTNEIRRCDILLANLEVAKKSISETGLGGYSRDVEAVVRFLTENRVQSSRAANTYLAELVPDAQKSRDLVMSDPARFLGVCVAQGEWDKTRNLLSKANLSLAAPVAVAVATLDQTASTEGLLVIGAADDAAYNHEAAKGVLENFERNIDRVEEEQGDYKRNLSDARTASRKLDRYLELYGQVRMAEMRREKNLLHNQAEALRASEKECVEDAAKEMELANQLNLKLRTIPADITRINLLITRLTDYRNDWEQPLAGTVARLVAVQGALAELLARKQVLDDLVEGNGEIINDSLENFHRLSERLKTLEAQKSAVQFYTQGAPGCALEPGFSLDVLISTYESVKSVFEYAEKDQIGVRLKSVEYHRHEEAEARKAFDQDYAGVAKSDVEPLLGLGLVLERKNQESENYRLEKVSRELNGQLAVADSNSAQFIQRHKPAPISEAMLQLSDDDVHLRIEALAEDISTLQRTVDADSVEYEKVKGEKVERELLLKGLNDSLKMLRNAIVVDIVAGDYIELIDSGKDQVGELLKRNREIIEVVETKRADANIRYQLYQGIASLPEFRALAPELSVKLYEFNFDQACNDYDDLQELVDERIKVTESQLSEMVPDFDRCVGELQQLIEQGASVLNRAAKVAVPIDAPYVGGKPIIRLKEQITGIVKESGKVIIAGYLNKLIEDNHIPENGSNLVSDGLVLFAPQRAFGLQILQMEQNVSHQYQFANSLKMSGGQSVVIAIFLYLLISKLRADSRVSSGVDNGCPLILDNPFAKVQTRALIDVQLMLAKAVGVQLIFFTATKEVNTLAGFQKVIRLRKGGVNSVTKRTQLQMVKSTVNTEIQQPVWSV
ncbi:hypothetical protein [Pseudomonas rhizophila]|nr:hypothetical protein [Pseudomonas sp. P13]